VSETLLILYLELHFFSAVLAGFLSYWSLTQTEMRSRRWFGILVLGLMIWSLTAAVELVLTGRGGQVAVEYLSLVVASTIPLVWVVFTADYTHRSTRGNPLVRALGAVYVLVVLTILTNPVLEFYAPLTVRQTPFSYVEVGVGPGRILVVAYVLASVALGIYYLASLFERGRSQVSTQVTILAGVVLLGAVPFLSTVLGLAPVSAYDHTPFGISIFLLGVGYVVFQYGFYDLAPIARDIVLNETADAMFVLDDRSRLVDYNTAATRIIPALTAERIGQQFGQLHPELAAVIDEIGDDQDREIALAVDGETRNFSVRLSEITRESETIGTVVFLRDITERRQREQQLKRQNERLDQFASMVSHDLRNPLNVARGRMELLDSDDENAESVENALDRMETMIDDMLRLARAGQDIEETAQCPLAEIAVDAWETVETGDSELDVRVENATLEADSTRLTQVFENLFRNALDHNEPPLTVRVGLLDSQTGFYVEDSGTGILADERGDVFDHGYTTREEGNGLGLALVRDIVEAHDWTITVAESAEGGARFEIHTGD
jgi:PAS domain S-box-containing protein